MLWLLICVLMGFDVIIIWCDHVLVISLLLVSHENVVVTVLSPFVSLDLLVLFCSRIFSGHSCYLFWKSWFFLVFVCSSI